jgi:hypothetical protein
VGRDWHVWYEDYDDPASSLSRRLRVVREQLAAVLGASGGPLRLASLCAGDGRDTLPVLAEIAPSTKAVLVELDPGLADRARRTAADLGLDGIEVRRADAGRAESLDGAVPCDVLLACGVFGNVTDADIATTVDHLPELLSPHATVIWTRGSTVDRDPTEQEGDPADYVRGLFNHGGFEEVAFIRPADAGFRVGVHRLAVEPAPFDPATRLFDFVK